MHAVDDLIGFGEAVDAAVSSDDILLDESMTVETVSSTNGNKFAFTGSVGLVIEPGLYLVTGEADVIEAPEGGEKYVSARLMLSGASVAKLDSAALYTLSSSSSSGGGISSVLSASLVKGTFAILCVGKPVTLEEVGSNWPTATVYIAYPAPVGTYRVHARMRLKKIV